MAKLLTSSQFDAMVQRLERMADGISKNKGLPDFPQRLKEDVRRQRRARLEELRARYEGFARDTAQAYDEYAEYYAECNKELGKDDDTLRGFHGKDSNLLPGYGTKPMGRPTGVKKAAKTTKVPKKNE